MNDSKAVQELERIFSFLNQRLFSGEIPPAMITIQSAGRRHGVFGWFTPDKLWRKKEEREEVQRWHEINIVAEHLSRSVEDIAETVLHEMVHLYNRSREVRDTSTNGKYHNKEFREAAEQHGLTVSHGKTIGWAVTALQESSRKLLEELRPDSEAFAVFRDIPMRAPRETKKFFSFGCDCGEIIKSENEELLCTCEACGSKFVRRFRGGNHHH